MQESRTEPAEAELAEVPLAVLRRAWWTGMWRARRNWQTWLGLMLCGACGGLGVYLGFTVARESVLVVQLLICAAFGVLGGFVLSRTWLRQARKHLRAYLRQTRHGGRGPEASP